MPRSPSPADLPEVLERAAAELDLMGAAGLRLQDALGPLLAGAGAAAEEAQGLDALTQQADGLAAFLRAVAGQLGASGAPDAAEAARPLTLSDQRRRLSGEAGWTTLSPEDTGVVELF